MLIPNDNRAEIRARHPGMLILLRTGESCAFMEEDRLAVERLGVPFSFATADLEHHLHTLLRAGQRIAVCDPVDSK